MVLVVFSLMLVAGCSAPSPEPPGPPEPPFPAAAAEARGAVDLDATLREAAGLITPESSLLHLGVLAHDSMMGRDTERPEIWTAARYLASQFEAMGLEPMDEDGDFIDEYPIVIPDMDAGQVRLVVAREGERLELRAGEDFATVPAVSAPSFSGLTVAPVVAHDWYRANPGRIPEGSLVLTHGPIMDMGNITEALRFGSWMENVQEAGANAVGMILPPTLPLEMMAFLQEQVGSSPMLDGPPMLMVPAATVERIFEFAGVAGPALEPLESIQNAPVEILFEMPVTTRTLTAPNVLARLPGDGERGLGDVVLTAHFDHEPPGPPTSEGDSILNGADDNASGTVGLLEAARAFASLTDPPARSVVFAAVSAEEMGLLGSAWLAEHGPAAASSTAANLNMDMLSRNGPDSLFVFGQTLSTLGPVFRGVLENHPELGFRIRPGHQMPDMDLLRFSDQAPYLERGVPVLMFNSGFHPELHTADDEVELADGDKLARAARLMFYLAYAVADDPVDPAWTEEGKARTQAMQRRLKRQGKG
jgi:hypothetical protein